MTVNTQTAVSGLHNKNQFFTTTFNKIGTWFFELPSNHFLEPLIYVCWVFLPAVFSVSVCLCSGMPASQGELSLSQLKHAYPDSYASAPSQSIRPKFFPLTTRPPPTTSTDAAAPPHSVPEQWQCVKAPPPSWHENPVWHKKVRTPNGKRCKTMEQTAIPKTFGAFFLVLILFILYFSVKNGRNVCLSLRLMDQIWHWGL